MKMEDLVITLVRDDENNYQSLENRDVSNLKLKEEKKNKDQEQAELNLLESIRSEEEHHEATRMEAARTEAALVQSKSQTGSIYNIFGGSGVNYTKIEVPGQIPQDYKAHIEAERRCMVKRMEQMDIFGWPFYNPHSYILWNPVPSYVITWYPTPLWGAGSVSGERANEPVIGRYIIL